MDRGIRASLTSITRSTFARLRVSCFSALAMWPGYHWIIWVLTALQLFDKGTRVITKLVQLASITFL